MDIVAPQQSGVKTVPPNCPVCDQPAIHWGHNQRVGTTEANYICELEHLWLTKWVTP